MNRRIVLWGAFWAAALSLSSVNAQEFAVPKKPNKRAMFEKNVKVNKRDPAGYLGVQATILVPLDDGAYALLYGSIAGKKDADSFHYFENADLGFVCTGVGRPAKGGGVVTNECFLNGGSTGRESISVPDYGKLTGSMIFNVYNNGELVGPAIMQWGLTYPSHKKLYKNLQAIGG